jgi:hypothetical protein
MVFKNIVVGNNVYGDDIRLYEIDKGFDCRRLTHRYTSVINLKLKSKYKYFDSRGINFELAQGK